MSACRKEILTCGEFQMRYPALPVTENHTHSSHFRGKTRVMMGMTVLLPRSDVKYQPKCTAAKQVFLCVCSVAVRRRLLYLTESHMWKGLSLLEQPGFGLPLVSMDNQNWTIPGDTTTGILMH